MDTLESDLGERLRSAWAKAGVGRLEGPQASVAENLLSGFIREIDGPIPDFAPKLIANHSGHTLLNALKTELGQCDGFDMSVAFVSKGMLAAMKQDFLDFGERTGAAARLHADGGGSEPSRIITSTFQYFNDPDMFRELLSLAEHTGIEARIWTGGAPGDAAVGDYRYHPKGYVFRTGGGGAASLRREAESGHGDAAGNDADAVYTMYVGSSNFTQNAMSSNREWNLRVSSLEQGSIVTQAREEIASQVAQSFPLTEEWIEQYEEEFRTFERVRREIREAEAAPAKSIEPNSMQREALASIEALRAAGETQAVVVSATGTGKTYLSAFDVRQVQPRRVLYIAERAQILKKSMESYAKVLGAPKEDFGYLGGGVKEQDRRYVFASVQTLARPEVLESFDPKAFDYILVDEVHHSAAATYKRVIDHFDPDFMLGMTATPERTDGQNIFSLFGNNLAYEIRLQRALEEDMLCPFHYYGVVEYLGKDDAVLDVHGGLDTKEKAQLEHEIRELASPDRVRYVIDKLQVYSDASVPVRGLVFCSRREEAYRLSELFNREMNQQAERTYRTRALTGENSEEEREAVVAELEAGELDYIFTVDLFNEGIDIPSVNQVVMLRNTQSSIIFTQQLGRGLRKAPGKDSLIVVDFIGNYRNNYLIPLALYGNTGDADRVRRNMTTETIGLCSISFDRISRERVLASLDTADLSEMKKLTEEYRNLRYRLGRVPMLMDFVKSDETKVLSMAQKDACYAALVASREKSLKWADVEELDFSGFGKAEWDMLKMLTEVLLSGVRPHELLALRELDKGSVTARELADLVAREFPGVYDEEVNAQFAAHALRVLSGKYFMVKSLNRFGGQGVAEVDAGVARLHPAVCKMRENPVFDAFFVDTVQAGLALSHSLFARARKAGARIERGFIYGEKYTLADAGRLCCWEDEQNPQNVGGYKYDRATETMPIFIKYEGSQYADRFLNTRDIDYFSKRDRSLKSPEFVWDRTRGTRGFIPVFIMRKADAKGKSYYFVGSALGFLNPHETVQIERDDEDGPTQGAKGEAEASAPEAKPAKEGRPKRLVNATLRLAHDVDPELFRHLTGRSSI